MYCQIEEWLNDILKQEMPSALIAFNFNVYMDGDDQWSLELVGTKSFDIDGEDWACDEITNFGTRDDPFMWEQDADWVDVLDKVIVTLKKYLKRGAYASVLKASKGVGVGFVDGNIEILYPECKLEN